MTALRRHRLVGVVAAALVVVAPACGGDDDVATTTTTTVAGGAFAPSGGCPMIPPGQLMSAAEATIRFSVDRICPGYVTIAPGTTIQIVNESTESSKVTIAQGPDGSGATVFDQKLGPGEEASVTFEESGFHLYRIGLLASFKGTIEVVEG